MSFPFRPGDPMPTLDLAGVSRAQVLAYVTCAGDDNPIHVDEAIAHAAGLSGLVLPGMLIAAQFPRLIQAWDKPVRLVDFDVQFLKPLAIDRPFLVTGKVAAILAESGLAVLRMTARDGPDMIAMAEAKVAPV